MGGSLSAKSRYNRWVNVAIIGVVMAGLVLLPVQAQPVAFEYYHPLIYPDGTLYVYNPGTGPATVSYTFYQTVGGVQATVSSHSIAGKHTERINLSKVNGLVSGTAYSLVIIADLPIETSVFVNRSPLDGDGLGAYCGIDHASGSSVFGPFYKNVNSTDSRVILFNPSDSVENVDLTFFSQAGDIVATGAMTILAKHVGTIQASDYPISDGFRGTVAISSPGLVGVLEQTGQSQYSIHKALRDSNDVEPPAGPYRATLPRLHRSALDGMVSRSSQLVLYNPGAAETTDVSITYYSSIGEVIPYNLNEPIASHGLKEIDTQAVPWLGDGNRYSVLVTSNEYLVLGEQSELDGQPYLPAGGFGARAVNTVHLSGLWHTMGISSALTVQNASENTQTVLLTFYDLAGTKRHEASAQVLAGSYTRIELGQIAGLSPSFEGSVTIDAVGAISAWVDRYPTPIAVYLPAIDRSACVGSLVSPHDITDTYTYLGWQKDMVQIHADDAWKACNLGSPSITVAVLDTGVDLNHPDLTANLLPGISFVEKNSSTQDQDGHGTHVSGIIAAGLNGEGIVGVAPQVRILPVRVLGPTGSGSTSWVINGIYWAAERAQILNLSLGTFRNDQPLRDAIDYAVNEKGRLVIAAAGNCGGYDWYNAGCPWQHATEYPAAYSNVIAVGAVTGYDDRAYFSNVGNYLDVSAPGVSIFSTFWDSGDGSTYTWYSGTSQATPHVAGLAALVWSRYPDYSAAQVRAAIESSAVDLGPSGWDSSYGWGRIDAAAALGMSGTLSTLAVDLSEPAEQTQPVEDRQEEILEGWVLVQYQPGVAPERIQQALQVLSGVELESVLPEIGIHRLRVPPGQEWKVIDRLRAQPEVLYAGPEYLYQAQ